MSLCINPGCPRPDHPDNGEALSCQACGTTLRLQDRYRVMRLLSTESGFGVVYEAYERSQPKILKVLRSDRANVPKVLSLFQHEAAVLSRLRHLGVPFVDDQGYFIVTPGDGGEPLHCIVMEKIEGLNLKQWMRQQGNHPIREDLARRWLTELTEILQQVHENSYFHRDIKPDNIMIRNSGELALVDFGAAREMTQTYLAQVSQGDGGVTAISSVGYTPPEQEYGQAVPQSDFYALGRTFIYLLTGKQPTDKDLYDSLRNRFEWRSHAGHISESLADLLDSMIALRVVDRPGTAAEILERLRQPYDGPDAPAASRGQPPLPRTTLNPGKATLTPDFVTRLQSAIGDVPAGKRRRSLGRWLATGLLLVAAGFAVHRADLPSLFSETPAPPSQQEAVRRPVQLQRTLSNRTASINELVVFVDGRRMLSAGADKAIRLWDLSNGDLLRAWIDQSSFVNALLLSPDETEFYSANADGSLQAWGLSDGALLWRRPEAHAGPINTIGRTPDGRLLVTGDAGGDLQVWEAETGSSLKSFQAHSGAVNSVVVTSDGQRIISGGTDRQIKVWELATGELIHRLEGHKSFVNSLAISLDGRFLFSASADGSVLKWQTDAGKPLKELIGHTSYVNDIVFSRDGQTLFSGGADKTVRSWNVSTGEPQEVLTGFDMVVDSLVISSSGQIVTANRIGPAIKVWLPER